MATMAAHSQNVENASRINDYEDIPCDLVEDSVSSSPQSSEVEELQDEVRDTNGKYTCSFSLTMSLPRSPCQSIAELFRRLHVIVLSWFCSCK